MYFNKYFMLNCVQLINNSKYQLRSFTQGDIGIVIPPLRRAFAVSPSPAPAVISRPIYRDLLHDSSFR